MSIPSAVPATPVGPVGTPPVGTLPVGPAVPPPPVTATALGVGVGGTLLFYIAERMLENDGQLAATMLTRLSPLAGPVWASWPILFLLVVLALWGATTWRTGQAVRAAEAAASVAAANKLATNVAEVATGLDGLRAEVHSGLAGLRTEVHSGLEGLRVELRAHDDALHTQGVGLAEVSAAVSHVSARVGLLETPRRKVAGPGRR